MALYSDVIRERFRRPLFRGAIERPDVAHEDVRLTEARWTGDCCAICAASADLLLEAALGQPVGFAQAETPSSLLERLDSDIRPSRMKCVTLPLTVLQDALSGQEVTR